EKGSGCTGTREASLSAAALQTGPARQGTRFSGRGCAQAGSAHPGEDRQGAHLQQRKSRFDGYFHGRPLPGARTLRRLRGRIEKNLLLQGETSAQGAGKEPATGWFRPDYSNGG